MVRLRRFNFIKMSGAISTFDVYPPSAAPEATRVHSFSFSSNLLILTLSLYLSHHEDHEEIEDKKCLTLWENLLAVSCQVSGFSNF